jgi:hypothetical protein
MPYQIVLPILEIKSSRLPRFFLMLYLIGAISLIVNVFFFEIKFLYIFSLGFIFSFGLFALVYDKNKDAGLLIIDEFGIKIRESDTIPISEISDLKITIVGFEGQMKNIRGMADSGNNNHIEFTHKSKNHKYNFFLSYQKMEMLDYISDKWKKEYPQLFRKEKSFLKDFILGKLNSKK